MGNDLEEHDRSAVDDIDNPELTEADFARGRPFTEVFPHLAGSLKRQGGRPKLDRPKVKVAWRLSADVVEAVKASGKGYNVRVEKILREAIARGVL